MLRSVLTVLILALSFFSFAQPLAPLGATWTYYTEDINPYKGWQDVIRAEKDTLIASRSCRAIVHYRYQKNNVLIPLETYYLHDSAGYVSVWLDNSFVPYFNFNASQGDTTGAMVRFDGDAALQYRVVVDTVYVQNGLKHFVLLPVTGQGRTGVRTVFIERILKPFYHYDFLPVLNIFTVMEGGTSLNCYRDNQLDYTWTTGRPCFDSSFYQVATPGSSYTVSRFRPAGSDSTLYYTLLSEAGAENSAWLRYSDHAGNRVAQGDLRVKQDDEQKVWVWNNNGWVLLYDFMAKAGDTITTTAVINPLHITNGATGYEDITTFRYIIDSVYQAGDQLVQVTRSIPGERWEMPGRILEGMGNIIALAGQPVAAGKPGNPGYVRCFSNNQLLKDLRYFVMNEVRRCDALTVWTSVEEELLAAAASLYPNPVTAAAGFTVKLPAGSQSLQMQVTDLLGRSLIERQLTQPETHIAVSNLPAGVYLVMLSKGEYTRAVKLVVR